MNYQEEKEIDLVRMLLKACLGWRTIAVVAIIVAFVVGGIKMATNIAHVLDPEVQEKAQQEYDAKVTAYEAEGRQLELAIEETERQIRVQEDYLDQSILMQLDPNQEWNGSMTLYVGTDYQIMPGSTYQNENQASKIVAAYGDYVDSGDFYTAVMDKLSFQVKDVRYLNEMLGVSVDTGRYVISISALADTREKCEELINTAKTLLLAAQSQITTQIDKHTIQTTEVRILSKENPDREAFQTNQKNAVQDMEATIANYRTDYIEWEAKEAELKLPIVTMKKAITNGIKFFLIAGLVMGFVMGGIYCVGYIFSGRVQGSESLPFGLHLIGEIPVGTEKKLNGIDKWFLGIFGVVAKREEKDARLGAAARHLSQLVETKVEGQKSVALISDMEKEELDKLVTSLGKSVASGVELVSAGNILVSPEGSKLAEDQSAVVLVAKQGVSVQKTLNAMVDQLKSYDKIILGAIVTEVEAK